MTSIGVDISSCACCYQNGVSEVGVDDFRKDTNNIFDEIDHIIKFNKIHEDQPPEMRNNNTVLQSSQINSKAPLLNNSGVSSGRPALPTLDMLSPAHEFLISEESHNYNEDPVLYSVERDELHPITSPFMVPGIYKKIATAPTANASISSSSTMGNVYITEGGTHGRIVSMADFHNLYTCANHTVQLTAEVVGEQPRRVLLLEQMEDDNNGISEVKPALSVIRNSSLVPKEWDALTKLAYDILKLSNRDHIVIDRLRNEIVRTERETNQRTIYRFLSPQNIGCKPKTEDNTKLSAEVQSTPLAVNRPNKLGRPRKRPVEGVAVGVPERKRTMKKAKTVSKEPSEGLLQQKPEDNSVQTRSGRVIKVVRPSLLPKASASASVDTVEKSVPIDGSQDLLRNFLAELKDSDFGCQKKMPINENSPMKADSPPMPIATSSPSKAHRTPPDAICPTCKKIFLGRRLQRHFTKYPEHMKPTPAMPTAPLPNSEVTNEFISPSSDDMTLFRFLISKLQKSRNLSEDQRAELFLNEINDLVEQLQLRCSRLIRNTSGLHLVTMRTARVLGIPEGQYALDMSAIEAPPEPETDTESHCLNNYDHLNSRTLPAPPNVNTRSLDYTALSMSLDDTLTDEAAQKLNLSAGGKLLPPSEESLLRAVDDLVHVGMKNLDAANLLHPPQVTNGGVNSTTLVPHYDHASDNAVEAVTMKPTNVADAAPPLLDLSVDFFQFNNN